MSKGTGNRRVTHTAVICLCLIGFIIWMFFSMTVGTDAPARQKEISVILYHTNSDGWESLQEGMRQAEDDFSVNINYVIMRENADGAEQLAAINREIENGADGILLAVCEYEPLMLSFIEDRFSVPVVMIESGLNDVSFSLISADNYAMGQRLGEEILKDFDGQDAPVVAIAYDSVKRDSVIQRRQGFLDALAGKAQVISMSVALGGEGADVVAAFHKDELLALADKKDTVWENAKIYGIGNTAANVAALDQNKISKLVFQNEFNVGYLGVEELLAELNGRSVEMPEIDFYCVSRPELYTTQYERLLFPLVE